MTDLLALQSLTPSGGASANEAARSRASLGQNFETFLTLLTAQLQNQDPLSPLDANQFTEQLVQYSQVEQQIRMNEQLGALLTQNTAAQAGGALAYLGQIATIDSNIAGLTDAGASWRVGAAEGASAARFTVLDSSGRAIFQTTAPMARGQSTFTWDGLRSDGVRASNGAYRLVAEGVMDNGERVPLSVSVEEPIIAVSFANGAPELMTAGGARAFEEVRAIRNPLN